MIKIAIVEDDKNMSDELKQFIVSYCNEKNIKSTIESFSSADLLINTFRSDYDIIFMDIDLPGTDGLTATKMLREQKSQALIIFVTSLAQYAIEGYKVDAFDYILKPVSRYTFDLTLKRALTKLGAFDASLIVVINKKSMKKIAISSIKYLEVIDHKLIFHTIDGNFETRGTLKEYTNVLKQYSFALCNQCYLVNLKYISEITNNKVIIDKDELPISRPKRNEFFEELNKYICSGGGSK